MNAPSVADRCHLTIKSDGHAGYILIADPSADCSSDGGVGTGIGTIRVERSSFDNAVGWEMHDPETFFSNAGACE